MGESKEDMKRVLTHITPEMPENKPRYLMGVGTPEDLVMAVSRGVDMFDCVMPTSEWAYGYLFTSAGVIKIRNAKHKPVISPLTNTGCYTCENFSRATYITWTVAVRCSGRC